VSLRGGRLQPHERISQIGGAGWRVGEEEAIAALKIDMNAFYIETDEGTAYLIVRIHEGREYLTTEADGNETKQLLSLPECQ
jgi:hypothetical protein